MCHSVFLLLPQLSRLVLALQPVLLARQALRLADRFKDMIHVNRFRTWTLDLEDITSLNFKELYLYVYTCM